MIKRLMILLVAGLAVACGGDSEDDGGTAADTLTRAQKDSIIADMPIPGAGGVGAAIRARDQANERAAAHDSIG